MEEKIKVMILEIDHDKRRISLGSNKQNQIHGQSLPTNMVLAIKLMVNKINNRFWYFCGFRRRH